MIENRLESTLHGEYEWLDNIRVSGRMSRTRLKVEDHPERGIEVVVSSKLATQPFPEICDEVRSILDRAEREIPEVIA